MHQVVFQGQYQLCDISQNVLEAWPKLGCSKELIEWLKTHPDPNRIALLDSGVFSTWSRGDVVDRDAYAKHLKGEKLFSHFVGLDVIPGSPGHVPTADEVEASAKQGWDNLQYLLDHGVDPTRIIHVFHQGERFDWLEKLVEFHESLLKQGLKEGAYIGISPANDRTTYQRMLWLDQCMPLITNKDGSARLRWHGFGATSTSFMHKYPWWTCDSTSWLRAGSFGMLRLPQKELPHPFYDSNLQVAMTGRSGLSVGSKHFNGLSKKAQEAIVQYIEANEFKLEDVCSDGKQGVTARQTLNLKYWKQLEKELNTMDNRWKKLQGTFL